MSSSAMKVKKKIKHCYKANITIHLLILCHDTWLIAWVTLGLMHVFLMSHDTKFIAWVTFNLLHALLLTLGIHLDDDAYQS